MGVQNTARGHLQLELLGEDRQSRNSDEKPTQRRLFLLTHNTSQGIGQLAANLKRYVTRHDSKNMVFFDSFAHTLSSRRSKLSFRVAVTACEQDELINSLDDVSKGIIRPVRAIEGPKICFAFTGT